MLSLGSFSPSETRAVIIQIWGFDYTFTISSEQYLFQKERQYKYCQRGEIQRVFEIQGLFEHIVGEIVVNPHELQ